MCTEYSYFPPKFDIQIFLCRGEISEYKIWGGNENIQCTNSTNLCVHYWVYSVKIFRAQHSNVLIGGENLCPY